MAKPDANDRVHHKPLGVVRGWQEKATTDWRLRITQETAGGIFFETRCEENQCQARRLDGWFQRQEQAAAEIRFARAGQGATPGSQKLACSQG